METPCRIRKRRISKKQTCTVGGGGREVAEKRPTGGLPKLPQYARTPRMHHPEYTLLSDFEMPPIEVKIAILFIRVRKHSLRLEMQLALFILLS